MSQVRILSPRPVLGSIQQPFLLHRNQADPVKFIWPCRLVARIPPFQGEEAGSKPVRATNIFALVGQWQSQGA